MSKLYLYPRILEMGYMDVISTKKPKPFCTQYITVVDKKPNRATLMALVEHKLQLSW